MALRGAEKKAVANQHARLNVRFLRSLLLRYMGFSFASMEDKMIINSSDELVDSIVYFTNKNTVSLP